jgi:D-alanine-D-alanine ligase
MQPGPPLAAAHRVIRLAVLYGGRSTEHSISCVSAAGVMGALDPSRYEIVPVGITPDGVWVLGPDDPAALRPRGDVLPVVDAAARRVALVADPTRPGLVELDTPGSPSVRELDAVFPVLHGPFGEDGTVQGLLEMAGLPYVGSGVFASAAAMDKEHMKILLAGAGLFVGPYAVVRAGQTLAATERDRLGLPVFVKPARGGSSIGITRVDDWSDLDTAVKTARAADSKVIIEAAIVGREIECGVLGGRAGGAPRPSVPAEIVVTAAAGFYDFDTKYLSDGARLDVPADVPAAATERVQAVARTAFTALDCAGLARVDVFLTPAGEVVVNEVNTMPGFTPTSLFPRMWAASGLDYPALVDELVGLALERPPAGTAQGTRGLVAARTGPARSTSTSNA